MSPRKTPVDLFARSRLSTLTEVKNAIHKEEQQVQEESQKVGISGGEARGGIGPTGPISNYTSPPQ